MDCDLPCCCVFPCCVRLDDINSGDKETWKYQFLRTIIRKEPGFPGITEITIVKTGKYEFRDITGTNILPVTFRQWFSDKIFGHVDEIELEGGEAGIPVDFAIYYNTLKDELKNLWYELSGRFPMRIMKKLGYLQRTGAGGGRLVFKEVPLHISKHFRRLAKCKALKEFYIARFGTDALADLIRNGHRDCEHYSKDEKRIVEYCVKFDCESTTRKLRFKTGRYWYIPEIVLPKSMFDPSDDENKYNDQRIENFFKPKKSKKRTRILLYDEELSD